MSKIKILSENLTNKIAAGEVVQRPASIIKELVENSIDAGADEIIVVIRNGGKSLCEVVDNGEGMNRDDLLLAFERYATSKIATVEDLGNIQTLGFRGEALASIAAVAVVTATSTLRGAAEGYELRIEGGSFREIRPSTPKPGTTISVRNLFYNIPARRKFLKSAEVEFRHIVDIMQKFALIRPDLRFIFIHNDHEIYTLTAESLPERIGHLFAPEYSQSLLPVEAESGDLRVTGFSGNLNLVRARRGEQFLFVNRRFVTDRLMNHAITSGYGGLLARSEFPFYCLNLEIPPEQIDVNVHPTKMEVKFRDQDRVYQFLKQATENSLKSITNVIPDLAAFAPKHYYSQPPLPKGTQIQIPSPLHPTPVISSVNQAAQPGPAPELPEIEQTAKPFAAGDREKWQERARRFAEQNQPDETADFRPSVAVYQVHNKYIISQIKSGLVIIDQHVAHERILFEEAQASMRGEQWKAQQLLFPVVLELTVTDFSTLLEVLPFLEKLGFRMKEFGKQSVAIEAVPAGLRWGNEKVIIREILDYYHEFGTKDSSIQDKVAAAYACKAAIKSGDPLTTEEMQNLIDRLFATRNPYFCPHGRPIIVNLSLKELDKRFERA
jgi:DNA mismatch repair protein MutL